MIWITYVRLEDERGNEFVGKPKAGDAWTVEQLAELVHRLQEGEAADA